MNVESKSFHSVLYAPADQLKQLVSKITSEVPTVNGRYKLTVEWEVDSDRIVVSQADVVKI